jgi:hypothetical protein
MLKDTFYIEHDSHYHCVYTWLKILNYSNQNIFIADDFISNMVEFNKAYLEKSKVYSLKSSIGRIIISFLSNKSKTRLIITTAPEHTMGLHEVLSVLIYILVKPDILCIRNPQMWITQKSTFKNLKIRHKLLILISKKLLKLLYFRSARVVCESSLQVNFIKTHLGPRNNVKFFSGRVSDLRPAAVKLSDNPAGNIIGVLGSVDKLRRDYRQLIQSILEIPIANRPKLAFLGELKNNSVDIISPIKDSIYFYSDTFVSEEIFFNIGNQCRILIAPLIKDKAYGAAYGSGSFADAIALNKSLLLPSHVPIPEEFRSFVKHYDSQNSLVNILNQIIAQSQPLLQNGFDNFFLSTIKNDLGC